MEIGNMDYYAYEYSVLHHLQDLLKIKCINCETETLHAYHKIRNDDEELKEVKTVSDRGYRIIRLDFDNNFHYGFDSRILMDEFHKYIPPAYAAEKIKRDIVDHFLKEFLLK